MLTLASGGVLVAVLGVLSGSGPAIGSGLTWAVVFALGGLHRHDWDAMNRRAGIQNPDH